MEAHLVKFLAKSETVPMELYSILVWHWHEMTHEVNGAIYLITSYDFL